MSYEITLASLSNNKRSLHLSETNTLMKKIEILKLNSQPFISSITGINREIGLIGGDIMICHFD